MQPDPLVYRYLAITDDNVIAGTPITIKATGHAGQASMSQPEVRGIAIYDALIGDNVTYIARGIFSMSDWTGVIGSSNLTPGLIYFLGSTTLLTSNPPTTGALVEIGRAQSTIALDVEIKTPILLG